MSSIGSRIKELLKKQDVSQKDLARYIGTTEASISRYVNDEREPEAKILYKIAQELHTTTDYLISGVVDNYEELELKIKQQKELINDLEAIRTDKNNPFKPRFYYDENLSDDYFPYAFCARPYDDNMSLHSFMKNGVLCGYASEHYDMWCKNKKPIKEMNFNEWAIKFIMPLIQENQTFQDRWQKLKEFIVENFEYFKNSYGIFDDIFADDYRKVLNKMKELEKEEKKW